MHARMLLDGPSGSPHRFLFAHGAGGPMDAPFMTEGARLLAARGIRVVRFEFPYMAARREGRKNSAPDRQPVLLEAWRTAIREQGGGGAVFVGGKSLGGRIASMVADEMGVRGVVCFGYPFHPPGKGQLLRTAHLQELTTPALILQGERDPFGSRQEVSGYRLSPQVRIRWIADGDHSFKPRKSSGVTEADNVRRAVDLAAEFILAPR